MESGSPKDYMENDYFLRPGMEKDRDEVIRKLIDIQYDRNDMDFHRGTFRVRGDVLEISPPRKVRRLYAWSFSATKLTESRRSIH